GIDAEEIYGKGKNDHKIINAALTLARSEKSARVVLGTKDINLRLKAKAIGLPSEDDETGKVKTAKNVSAGFPVIENIAATTISELHRKGRTADTDFLGSHKMANGYYILKSGNDSVLARYDETSDTVERVEKTYVYNI